MLVPVNVKVSVFVPGGASAGIVSNKSTSISLFDAPNRNTEHAISALPPDAGIAVQVVIVPFAQPPLQ